METFKAIAERIASLLEEKNTAYGNSFDQAGDFLKLLYPNGVSPEQYHDMLCIVRIFDKLKRIATNKTAFGESPYQDIVGYGILGLRRVSSNTEAPVEKQQPDRREDVTPLTEFPEEKRRNDSAWYRGRKDAVAGACFSSGLEQTIDEQNEYIRGYKSVKVGGK